MHISFTTIVFNSVAQLGQSPFSRSFVFIGLVLFFVLANTKWCHLYRLGMFANQLLLIANQFEIVEQKMLIVLNSLFSPLIHKYVNVQASVVGPQ